MNAWEYVRVGIGQPVEGNQLLGSRASDKYLWHCSHHLKAAGGIWQRTTGTEEVKGENDVDTGHVDKLPEHP